MDAKQGPIDIESWDEAYNLALQYFESNKASPITTRISAYQEILTDKGFSLDKFKLFINLLPDIEAIRKFEGIS